MELKSAAHQKRFLNCWKAQQLFAVRCDLINWGVKAETTTAEIAPKAEPPGPPPAHSLADTCQQTMNIVAANSAGHIPDRLDPSRIQDLYACSTVTPTGQCERSGDLVRVPGDLAQPLPWESLSSAAYCTGRVRVGVEIVLKNPTRNDGTKRYLRCIDRVKLGQVYSYLVSIGAKK